MALSTTAGAGSVFTPPEFAEYFLTHLHAQSVGLVSGLRVVTTSRDELRVPRLTADAASAWTAENAEITPADPTADELVARPSKLAALTFASNETVADSNPAVLNMLGESLARSIALKLDLGIFEGSGTAPEIRGLKNTTGIQTVSMGANGAELTNLDPIADALGMLVEKNAQGSAVVMHPRTWRKLLKLKDQASGSNKPLLLQENVNDAPVPSIYGVRVYLSSQLSTTETQGTSTTASSVYVYDPAQVL